MDRTGVVADTLNRDYCISPEEDRQHALLIAAAPELLASLMKCVAILNSLDASEGPLGAHLKSVIKQAYIAIGKATPT